MAKLANYVDFFSTKNVFVRIRALLLDTETRAFPSIVTRPHFDQHANVILASPPFASSSHLFFLGVP